MYDLKRLLRRAHTFMFPMSNMGTLLYYGNDNIIIWRACINFALLISKTFLVFEKIFEKV